MQYEVAQIHATLQGEGIHAGRRMILLRLQGCNLNCPWCDTSHAKPVSVSDRSIHAENRTYCGRVGACEQDIADYVFALSRKNATKCVLLTGGEPTVWRLQLLIAALRSYDLWVHLETNGTSWQHNENYEFVTLSPKLSVLRGNTIPLGFVTRADEIKFVVAAERPEELEVIYDWLSEYDNHISTDVPIIIQPCYDKNYDANVAYCVDAVRFWKGPLVMQVRLGLQLHRILGIE